MVYKPVALVSSGNVLKKQALTHMHILYMCMYTYMYVYLYMYVQGIIIVHVHVAKCTIFGGNGVSDSGLAESRVVKSSHKS